VGDNTWLRLIVDDTNVYHETNKEFEDVNDWYHFSAVKYITLSAGSHDIELEYKTEGDTGRFRNSRIIAVEMTIPANQYAENEGTTESTSAEVTAAQTTFTPASAGDYMIIASANVWHDHALSSVWGRLYIDGTVYGETLIEPTDITNERFNFGAFKNITLSATSHTIKLTVQTDKSGVSSFMNHVHIAAIRLDTFSEVHYNEAEGQNNGAGAWETLVTNSYTPKKDGDFFILGTAEWFSNDFSALSGIRTQTASTTRQESRIENKDATDLLMTFQMDKRELSGAQSDNVDHYVVSAGWSKFARLIALPLGLDYVRITGESNNDRFGFSVSNAGDINNSGYDDVIIGAPGDDKAYIFCGYDSMNYSITAADANVTLTGTASTNFGWSVGNCSDVNADGTYDDVIVGAPDSTNGNAYIYYGGNPMNTGVDLTLTGEAAGDRFGYSVHYAGDIDADGDPDVIVGAPYHTDGGRTNCGALYVYSGGSGIDSTADYTNYGEYAGDHFGWAVSFAGDIDGDDLNETLSGAPHYNTQSGETPPSAADAGKAYIHVIPEFDEIAFVFVLILIASMVAVSIRKKKR
ncbi:MAG: FG-GAP repeat protein, partial [Thermoplasmata archaeon]